MDIGVLASSSSGNCFFFENSDGIYLIDAGISAKQICESLASIGKNILSVKGVFVTHEHMDHIKGVKVLSSRYGIPIFLTKGTLEGSPFSIENYSFISANEKIYAGDCLVEPFLKSHDAREPVSFVVSSEDKTVSFITDVGISNDSIKDAVSRSDVLILETNHDSDLLEQGPYPYYLKKRIKGDEGHLSNYDAGLLVLEHGNKNLQHVFFSHLSDTNNTEAHVFNTFSSILKCRKDLKPNFLMTYKGKPSKVVRL